ncbi:DUF3558 domain-containing protein [Nocardia neocaledoniensis]|uniref:DUF3558 domain-containing protein n=1 Tax=Nocardia neocaledoniensis TaxID=236511 RepID=UPI002453B22C|nr:DUF3558 domain-containing protein [Nocardia neocaledoniensis]
MSRGSQAVAGLALAGMLLVGGCGQEKPSDEATPAPTSSDVPLPTGFDGCNLPQSLIAAEQLKNMGEDKNWNSPGSSRKWSGCTWVQSDGFTAGVTVTTITLQNILDSPSSTWTIGDRFAIGDRAVVTYSQPVDDPAEKCMLNVEMSGGSMEITLLNQPSARKSKGRHACDIAKSLATQLAPTIPAGS